VDIRSLRRAVRRRLVAVRAWVAWSPRRARTLLGVCLVVLVGGPLAAGITRTVTAPPEPEAAGTTAAASPAASPAPSPAVATPAPAATPSGAADLDSSEASSAEQAAASAAAQRFASLWLAGAFVHDRKRWADSMSGLVDPSLRPFLVATPASAIPRTAIASALPRLVSPSYGVVRVTFTDGTGMDLEVSATGSTWRVVQYLPASTP
jgi:hypothetical protein